jgi:hypothetical protein
MQDEATVEVGTVGNEGFSGVEVFTGSSDALHSYICQIAGDSLRRKSHLALAESGNAGARATIIFATTSASIHAIQFLEVTVTMVNAAAPATPTSVAILGRRLRTAVYLGVIVCVLVPG